MKCNWCSGKTGTIVDGYHPGCLDAKNRCANDKKNPYEPAALPRVRRGREAGDAPTKMSPTYAAQVRDFQQRMARRGIKIRTSY